MAPSSVIATLPVVPVGTAAYHIDPCEPLAESTCCVLAISVAVTPPIVTDAVPPNAGDGMYSDPTPTTIILDASAAPKL